MSVSQDVPPTPLSKETPVLEVEGLTTQFKSKSRTVTAVDNVSFSLMPGETLAIVGESGSGKSVTAMSLIRLLSEPPAKIYAKRIQFGDTDLLSLDADEWRRIRGNRIAMIFQDPMSSLHPIRRIGDQIAEVLETHTDMNREQRTARVIELLELVRIPEPKQRMQEYPHNLSGGMKQRVMIAIALACNPQLLIADEPTTALDVTIQAQILNLLKDLQKRLGMAVIFITHDMGVVAETADRVLVLYAGRVAETASVTDLFQKTRHPYTAGLIGAIPKIDFAALHGADRLQEIPGVVPALWDLPEGCAFAARCKYATDDCIAGRPPLVEIAPGQFVACIRADTLGELNQ
ncbi:ABC transporter ATP-binding protein [Oceaniovalibus sp. ACAM 378]|uniref:ABC transporter ATP-binding protein n=1 Tax=Oceaniovalibus sp. ACAM 378 TaxID=2599923 RepID=UPI0011D97A4B|nr:ABC transporter ATP-binding protein [Oceaniovalibus sp. ACAM 378]TYB84735.1 ABC transporter ATP-binding protein [Oceaniovalibus sp. ACAM 378]